MAYKQDKNPFGDGAYANPNTGGFRSAWSQIDFTMEPILDYTADGYDIKRKKNPTDKTSPESIDEEKLEIEKVKLEKDPSIVEKKPSKVEEVATTSGKDYLTKGIKPMYRDKDNSPAKYLNPNTLEVEGDAGQATEQPSSRAGRPTNSNVLMNDPVNYQDPSKISAQQNQQEQLFSGLASSAGMINDLNQQTNMIPNPQPDQSITPNIPSPFNQNGKGDPPPKKMFGSEILYNENKSYEDAVDAYDDSSKVFFDAVDKDDWSKKMPTYPKMSDHFHAISKDDESPAKKTGWIQEATADIKRRGTEGVCTGDKFGSASCPPGSKRYNLAQTFKKMAKNRKK